MGAGQGGPVVTWVRAQPPEPRTRPPPLRRASDKCQREKRKTINGDDLLWAMQTLGFEEYIEPLKAYLAKYREVGAGEGWWQWAAGEGGPPWALQCRQPPSALRCPALPSDQLPPWPGSSFCCRARSRRWRRAANRWGSRTIHETPHSMRSGAWACNRLPTSRASV